MQVSEPVLRVIGSCSLVRNHSFSTCNRTPACHVSPRTSQVSFHLTICQCQKPTGACGATSLWLRFDRWVLILDNAGVMPHECCVSFFSIANASSTCSCGLPASLSESVVSLSLLYGHCSRS